MKQSGINEEKMIRPAIYAGSWYPSERSEIEKYFIAGKQKVKALAAVCPHAGWVYSGKTAGKVFSRMQSAPLYILIGPNHHGLGEPVSIFGTGSWNTPLGELKVDNEIAEAILNNSDYAKNDPMAHSQEHSLEVLMPFIKLSNPEAKIVPICMYDYNLKVCIDLGMAIADALKQAHKQAVIVASSDMSHYVPADYAKQVDGFAIDKILALDPKGLLETVMKNNISMCGAGPAATALIAANELGAKKAELIEYTNSGAVTGDNTEVVGYAGLIVS